MASPNDMLSDDRTMAKKGDFLFSLPSVYLQTLVTSSECDKQIASSSPDKYLVISPVK